MSAINPSWAIDHQLKLWSRRAFKCRKRHARDTSHHNTSASPTGTQQGPTHTAAVAPFMGLYSPARPCGPELNAMLRSADLPGYLSRGLWRANRTVRYVHLLTIIT
eukprot:scaffold184841_cov21-Prasinocladus_malaysianus.AAC.1